LSIRIRLKPENSNSNRFELHRPLIKGIQLLLKVIKTSIINSQFSDQNRQDAISSVSAVQNSVRSPR